VPNVSRKGDASIARCGVIACKSVVPFETKERSLEEVLYELTQGVLAENGLRIEDIDGIIVAANDQLDGRAISIMAASGSVGGVSRDILSTPSSGEHAFVLGALRVASGYFRTQLILAWSPTEVANVSEALRLAADPYFHRALPMDEWSAHALQASRLESAVPDAATAALHVVAKNRRCGRLAFPGQVVGSSDPAAIAASAPFRWPLTREMVAPPVSGAVALVVASEAFIAERKIANPAWIRGMGWAAESGFLGDRDLVGLPGLASAVEQAYCQAEIADPRKSIALAEVADMTPHQELLAWERLGFCSREQWKREAIAGTFGEKGKMPVNLSGGALSMNPIFCTGLLRIAEAVTQVRGQAGTRQVAAAELAVAHAASGPAMQYNTVVVLGRSNGVPQ
jgi:acetyl-CoA C-acetyltransferase